METTHLPFSKTRRVGSLVFLSGELAMRPDGSMPEGIALQTATTIEKIEATLKTLGLGLQDVVSVTAFLVDTADFSMFNTVYARYFQDPLPVRTTLRADLMLPGALLELAIIANMRP